jgi:tripartite-type tricarboxylate transporter receptor subunit TctC
MRGRIAALASALFLVVPTNGASAQDFPTRPIRIIIPYAAAGGSDITTRIVQAKAAAMLGQPLVIENRPGGGTVPGTQAVAAADPDGYTVGVMDPAFLVNPSLLASAKYDPLKDFVPVTLITATPLMLVVPPSSPAKSLKELIDYAKANPGKLNYGSPGNGSAGHLAVEQLRSVLGLNMVHIPYRGAGPAVAAIVAGEVSLLLAGSGATPFVQDGKLRALAVTSPQRLSTLPDVPTFAELGYPNINVQTFAGIVAPKGTPQAAVAKIHAAFAAATRTPEIKAKLENMSQFPMGNTPAEFAEFLRANGAALNQVIRDAHIKVE